ncbi:uncharacterized protein LOC8033373 [Ixodes scapularis]|uniref:uncharacterized protein LOC8033373 n=1 Tax=Ixodes scapularis TaxID=6945 RepID=UPI001C37FA3C|nr:uncharacterized protein LOC8033373 [Ixodes scapularis]
MQPAVLFVLVSVSFAGICTGYSLHLNLSEETVTDVSVARNLPLAILPVALAIAGPVIAILFGSLKLVLLSFALIYLFLFGLTFVPTLGVHVQSVFRALGDTLTAAVPPTIGEDLLRSAGLDAEECRTRAVCEVTEDAVRRYPTVAAMLRSLSGAVQAQEGSKFVLKGILGGLSGLGCESLYDACKKSPLEKVLKALS